MGIGSWTLRCLGIPWMSPVSSRATSIIPFSCSSGYPRNIGFFSPFTVMYSRRSLSSSNDCDTGLDHSPVWTTIGPPPAVSAANSIALLSSVSVVSACS